MNLDTLVVEIYQWIMKTMKVVQHTNNYSKNIIETLTLSLKTLQKQDGFQFCSNILIINIF